MNGTAIQQRDSSLPPRDLRMVALFCKPGQAGGAWHGHCK